MARKKRQNRQVLKAQEEATMSSKSAASVAAARRFRFSSISRRQWIVGAVGVITAIGGATALNAWDVQTQEQHDLSVIGAGAPVVVQIHDRSCALCRRLKSAMSTVMDDRDDVIFRIADIAKMDGSELQARFSVPNVSLLFFDGSGKHRYTHTGVQTPDELNALIDNVMEQMNNLAS